MDRPLAAFGGSHLDHQEALPSTKMFAVEVMILALSGRRRRRDMLYTLAVILLIAWLLGVVGTYTIGAFVHVLLVVAIVLFIVGLLNGRRTVA
jgi:hypothetical protein